MPETCEPYVSVVTPFYNTADYLAECIESVLVQTYGNFEYILLDNCSTDGSREIAERYAQKDPRIRLHHNAGFLSQVANYNAALELISPESRFTKIVQADDKVFPTCLAEMVRVAESDKRVGLVSSLAMRGTKVIMTGFPFQEEVVSGRAIGREQLLKSVRFFGSPTTVLYRSEIVRTKKPFYDERLLHEDSENCHEILLDWDFGFVNRVLTYLRMDNDSIMSRVQNFDPRWPLLDQLVAIRRFGPRYLTKEEFEECWKGIEWQYVLYLGDRYFLVWDSRFWARHRKGTRSIDYRPNRLRLIYYGIQSLAAFCKKRFLKGIQGIGLAGCK